ncbi:unnamed protein product [Pylaiella littoralis]
MSAAEAGPAAAVSKPGKCERMLWLGDQKHVIQYEWRPDNSRREVLPITILVDKKSPNRPSNKQQVFVDNTEESVASKVLEMAHRVLKNKRERWEKAHGRSGRSSSSSSGGGARRNADREVADPVMAALRGCGRPLSGVTISEPAEPTAPADWRQ